MTNTKTFLNSFDKVFVINLPERIDRRKAIQAELDWLGPTDRDRIEIFPAVKPSDPGGFPSIGARGCFMSHLEILRTARDRGLKRILIVEDDLMFSKYLKKCQNEVARHVEDGMYDILYLGHMLEVESAGTLRFEKYEKPLMQSHFIAFKGNVVVQLVHCFEAMLARAPGHPDGGPMHVDGAYSTFRMQNPQSTMQIAVPNLGFQRPSPSDIAGFRWFDRISGIKELSALVRRFRILWMRNA